ncbi:MULTISPECIES: hypothetical protein [unclassified Microbacterium]|uniref:hypothetical protein n=1 Tax=unclassified Microbacterium TaxID=2609290 RepID=UPI00300FFD8A
MLRGESDADAASPPVHGIRAWHLRRDDGPEPSIAAEMVVLRGPWRPVQAAPDSTGREIVVV